MLIWALITLELAGLLFQGFEEAVMLSGGQIWCRVMIMARILRLREILMKNEL
jgi:hypothetical protein